MITSEYKEGCIISNALKKSEFYLLFSEFQGFFFVMLSWGLALAKYVQYRFFSPIYGHKLTLTNRV